ncbi:MAG TPA: RecX family transcriptional regulator, partial [Saprospiraceae bacterium]|nr:RecX family transcriptional regulator [Saprospiraceae bacterium]
MAKKEKNILRDIMQYCAKAEHCTQDVVSKLNAWKVDESEVESILEQLRNENFINDARYAKAYVNDKWKLDRWGKK